MFCISILPAKIFSNAHPEQNDLRNTEKMNDINSLTREVNNRIGIIPTSITNQSIKAMLNHNCNGGDGAGISDSIIPSYSNIAVKSLCYSTVLLYYRPFIYKLVHKC